MHSNEFVESLICVHQIMEYADDVSKVLGLKLHKFAGHVIILDTNIWNDHVVIWQTMSKNCATYRGRLFFLVQPIRSLFSSSVAAVAIILA